MNSCLYVGRVAHTRVEPIEHRFEYRHFLLGLDLDELEHVFDRRWLWSIERANLASFRRSDMLGDPSRPLSEAVRARVCSELGRDPRGPVRVFTQPRLFGFAFNPVSFYACYAEDGIALEAIVAEITNTPWKERHAYVLDARSRPELVFRFDKRFHVSPFMGMEHEYRWSFDAPGETLAVRMENLERGRTMFTAHMQLHRKPIDGPNLARVLATYPGFSMRTLAAIYWQALRLRVKGLPFHSHPKWKGADAGVPTR